ncbi:hypothetical protein ACNKHP_19690 [Shigella boydii]
MALAKVGGGVDSLTRQSGRSAHCGNGLLPAAGPLFAMPYSYRFL